MQLNNASAIVRAICLTAILIMAGTNQAGAISVLDAGLDTLAMNHFLEGQAAVLRDEAHARIDTREKLDAQREKLHREFLFMLGLDPLPDRTPLEDKVVRVIDADKYTIEVMYYQSLPGFYVTANLYRPKKGKAPFPATIWGPGHGNGVYGVKTSRQQHASEWATNGYICMVIDPVQAAEVYGLHHGLSGYDLKEWYSRGYTPMAIEVWNTMRAVDYLLSRKDVDGRKITLTGVSGGGHLSWMAGTADPRIAVVQPAAGTADVAAHIKYNLQNMHCDCAYFPNTWRHDWPTLAGIIAPRALLMHNSVGDDYYPPEGYKAVLARAKEIFSWYGAADKTDMCEAPGPHGYYPPQRERAVAFSDLMLFGRKTKIVSRPVKAVPEEQLGALGGIYGPHPENINAKVHEILLPEVRPAEYTSAGEWQTRREKLIGDLRGIVLRNMPAPVEPRLEPGEPGAPYLLRTEPEIRVAMYSDIPQQSEKIRAAVIYIASPGDTPGNSLWSFMKPFPLPEEGVARHMLYPRGIGVNIWDAETLKRYERDALILGRTLDDMRLYDVLCAIQHALEGPEMKDCREVTLVGQGQQAVLAAYAALLDERVTRVIMHSPTVSHKSGPHFLNVLRFTDLPEVLAALAPRVELVFLTHEIDSFGFARGIYSLCGAPEKFRRCMSVTQAINLPRK